MAKKTAVTATTRTDLDKLKGLVRHSAQVYRDSKVEAQRAFDLFHGRGHLTVEQENILALRGQPKQIHNIIKEFTLKLSGYITATRKEIAVKPAAMQYSPVANVTNDVIGTVHRRNKLDVLHFISIQDLLLSGVTCTEQIAYKTGEKDRFGRPVYDIEMSNVPETERFLDPWSRSMDYSDSRWFTRRKWVGSYDFEEMFGAEKLKEASPFSTVLSGLTGYEWDVQQTFTACDEYRESTVYEVLHTVMRVEKKIMSYYWNDSSILYQQDVTGQPNAFRYNIQRLFNPDKAEYYGIFRDLFGTQDAVNQSIIAMQHMLNTSKVLIEEDAVDNIDKFTADYNKINGVAKVRSGALAENKIRVEKFTVDLVNYQRKLADDIGRAERSIPMNDAFQGLAPASDSGKKVELQQQSVLVGQSYALIASDSLLQQWGYTTLGLVKQYFRAEQVFRITEGEDRDRWLAINEPITDPLSGDMVFQVARDPDTGKPMTDDDGTFVMEPMAKMENCLGVGEYEMEIRTRPTGIGRQENEETLLFAITSLQNIMRPSSRAKIISLYIRNRDVKDSEKMAQIIDDEAKFLVQMETNAVQPGAAPGAMQPQMTA